MHCTRRIHQSTTCTTPKCPTEASEIWVRPKQVRLCIKGSSRFSRPGRFSVADLTTQIGRVYVESVHAMLLNPLHHTHRIPVREQHELLNQLVRAVPFLDRYHRLGAREGGTEGEKRREHERDGETARKLSKSRRTFKSQPVHLDPVSQDPVRLDPVWTLSVWIWSFWTPTYKKVYKACKNLYKTY